MRIAALLGSKDEVELIDAAVAQLRAVGVHHVIASDAGSRDGTAERLAAMEGPGLELMPFDDTDYAGGQAEAEATRAVMERARAAGCDWLLFCDADEFWLPAAGRLSRVAALRDPEVSMLSVPRHNVPLGPGGPLAPLPPLGRTGEVLLYAPAEGGRESQRRVKRDPDLPWIGAIPNDKAMVRLDAETDVGDGGHPRAGAAGTARPADLVIAHVPFSTEARFARKIENIRRLVAASGAEWRPNSAWHWRRWLERMDEGGPSAEMARNAVGAEELARLRAEGVVVSAADLLARAQDGAL